MASPHVIIIGGGLAGLATGCYARTSGFRTTILEHHLALGGVCTAWPRGPYLIDGCIHWLTGGPFAGAYRELEIVPSVPLRTLEQWVTYRDEREDSDIAVTRNLDALGRDLVRIAPEDHTEINRLLEAAAQFPEFPVPVGRPRELTTFREQLVGLWEMREALGSFIHYRKPTTEWTQSHLRSKRLQRLFMRLVPEQAPVLVLLMVLGYLQRGWLSRPVGGTARFRDALIDRYERLEGESRLNATVEEVVVQDGRACGVRLADGTLLDADMVVSTASTPETVLRLLGAQYGGDAARRQLEQWKLFEPIVLASFGVEMALEGAPSMQLIDGIEPFEVGGVRNEHLSVRVCNDDVCFAPAGHTVVQAMVATSYDWWATRGSLYTREKDATGERVLGQLDRRFPGLRRATRMVDVVTPITYWNMARSWRGAYEGWMPSTDSFFGHLPKTLPGLGGFYMAGQWVEPGGGVPTAINSGRQVVQLLCADAGRPFVPVLSASA
ncbi:MAG: phytoene desaturase family protein [Myxococcaceae bacterium]